MSFLDHLEELRWHIIRSAIAIVVFAVVAFIMKGFIFDTVILEGGRTIEEGNVIIPFYSDGSSEYFAVKVNSEGNNLFFRKEKNDKSPDLIDEIQVLK